MQTPKQYGLYFVDDLPEKEGQEQKSIWTLIGRLFAHKDGKGFDEVFNLIPVELFQKRRLVIRELPDKE